MSFLSHLFPYRSFLEAEILRLREHNQLLLDRILLLTTGSPLSAVNGATEASLTDDEKSAVRKKIDEMSDDKPYGGYPTFASMLQDMEAASFKEDARRITGREEIEEGAELTNDLEYADEDEKKAILSRRKAMQQAAAQAAAEYKAGTKAVEVGK